MLVFVVRGCYIGLARGFSVELFKTLGVVVASVLTLLYYLEAGAWLASHSFLSIELADSVSFVVLIFSLLIVIKAVRILLFRVLHLELFYGLERWGGFTLGLARSVIFASLFLFALTILPVTYIKESVQEKSFFGPYLTPVAPKVLNFIMQFSPK